jgi:hypothetical protein
MTTANIRKKLHQFIEVAEEKKVKAIYVLFKDEITQNEWEYSDSFKEKLDRRYAYYKGGGKMIIAADADKEIKGLRAKGRKK